METNNIKVRAYDLEGNFLADYESQREASVALDIDEKSVSNAVNDVTNFAHHFQFRKVNRLTPMKIGNVLDCFNSGRKSKCIGKYFNGNLICVYNTSSEAHEKNKMVKGTITHCIQKNKSYRGFTFKEIL